jgi:cellulose synthase operon protein C
MDWRVVSLREAAGKLKRLPVFIMIALVLCAALGGAWWALFHRENALDAARRLVKKGDYAAALIELRNAVQDEPNNAEAHMLRGGALVEAGDGFAAEKELMRAQALGSIDDDLPIRLAESYLLEDRAREVVEKFLPPSTSPERTAHLLLTRAMAFVKLKDAESAFHEIDAAKIFMPESPDPPFVAAQIAVWKKDLTVAMNEVNEALKLDGKRNDIQLLKAKIYNIQGLTSNALDVLNATIAATPGYYPAVLERAVTLMAMGQDDLAKLDVNSVLAKANRSITAQFLRAILMVRADTTVAANAAFDRMANRMEQFPAGYYYYAIAKFDLHAYPRALELAQLYVNHFPKDIRGIKLLARVLLASGYAERASAVVDAAIQAGDGDADIYDLKGRSYAALGKSFLAAEAFSRALELQPENAEIMMHLVMAKLGAGDTIGANDQFRFALQLIPGRKTSPEMQVISALATADLNLASFALNALREQQGETETTGLLNGALLTMQQDYAGAVAQFEKLLKANPKSSNAAIALAGILQLTDRSDEAEAILTKLYEEQPGDDTAMSALLRTQMENQHADAAVKMVEAAYAAHPLKPGMLQTLSDLYVRIGAPERAVQLFAQAEKLQPPGPQFFELRARAELAMGQPDKARDSYAQALYLSPSNLELARRAAELDANAKNWDGARNTLIGALWHHPRDVWLQRMLVKIDFAAGGEALAADTIAKLRESPIKRDGTITLSADLALLAKRYRKAAEAYMELAKTNPNGELVLLASDAYMADRQPAQARKVLADFLAQHPNDISILRRQSEFAIVDRQMPQATALLEKMVSIAPFDPVALNNLAWVYQQTNDSRALNLARRGFLLRPTAMTADTLGWILVNQGNVMGGLPHLIRAANTMPPNPTIQFHLASALRAAGRDDEARKLLTELAGSPKQFPERQAAVQMLQQMRAPK